MISKNKTPENCGYMKKFHHNIDMNSNGITEDCIRWCEDHCRGKWGWWFESIGDSDQPASHWEEQNAYMSFANKRDATRFWLSVRAMNIGKIDNY